MTALRKGAFYWARVKTGRERAVDFMPESEWQPVRYTGKSADTHAREETRGDEIVIIGYSPDTWDFIGLRSEDGHHFADVIEVGELIARPTEPFKCCGADPCCDGCDDPIVPTRPGYPEKQA